MSRTSRKDRPQISTTWLAELISGQDHCWWAAGFEAHNFYQKVQSQGFDSLAWEVDHTAMVEEVSGRFAAKGHRVTFERQNDFRVGTGIILTGRPDIVAVSPEEVVVADAKTGARRIAHFAQILIYLWALRRTHEALRTVPGAQPRRLYGLIVYKDGEMGCTEDDLGSMGGSLRDTSQARTFSERMIEALQMISMMPESLIKVPSFAECRNCPIPKTHCPERMETEEAKSVEVPEF